MTLFYVTFPDRETAAEIGRDAVEERIAACANLLPIDSIYRWEGEVVEDDEVAALFKAGDETADAFTDWMEERHPYDVPCILELGGAANPAYAEWVETVTGRD